MAETEQAMMRRVFDQAVASMAHRLTEITRKHKRIWKAKIHDRIGALDADRYRARKRSIRQSMRPDYIRVVRSVIRETAAKAYNATREANGWAEDIGEARPEAIQNTQPNFAEVLDVTVDSLADEILQKQQGYFDDQSREQMGSVDTEDLEPPEKSLDRLKRSTLEGVGERSNAKAVNFGRDKAATDYMDETGATLMAQRNAVLDDATCDPCAKLHKAKWYVVGSAPYREDLPPAKCEGDERCRCWMVYEEKKPGEIASMALQDGVEMLHSGGMTFVADQVSGEPSDPIKIYPWGVVKHPDAPGGEYEIDREFYQKMESSFRYLSNRMGYHPPILIEHEGRGRRFGEVVGIECRPGDGIYAYPAFHEQIRQEIEAGTVDKVSPAHLYDHEVAETGDVLPLVLSEVSIVSKPHFKSLPGLQEQLAASVAKAIGHNSAEAYTMTLTHDDSDIDTGTEGVESDQDGEKSAEGKAGGAEQVLKRIESKLDRLLDGDQGAVEQAPSLPSPPDKVSAAASKGVDLASSRDVEVGEATLKIANRLADGKAPPGGAVSDYVSAVRELLAKDSAMFDSEGKLNEHGILVKLHGGPAAAGYADRLESAASGSSSEGQMAGEDGDDEGVESDQDGGDGDGEGSNLQMDARVKRIIRHDLESSGVKATEQRVSMLEGAFKRPEDDYDETIRMLKESAANATDKDGGDGNGESGPHDVEHGAPGSPSPAGPRDVVEQAYSEGVSMGRPLTEYLEDHGVTAAEAQPHIQDVYDVAM